jgi:hypothetical protein
MESRGARRVWRDGRGSREEDRRRRGGGGGEDNESCTESDGVMHLERKCTV